MIRSREDGGAASGGPWQRGSLAVALLAAAFSGSLLACSRGLSDAHSSEPTDIVVSPDASRESTARGLSPSEASHAVDLAAFVTDSFVAQQGTCLPTQRAPARSRLIYSLLPTEASYLRLSVVTSPDGTRPVVVDLARGLTGGRILYATLARGAELVRLETFHSASDSHPLVSDVPLEDPLVRNLLFLAERALTLRCQGA